MISVSLSLPLAVLLPWVLLEASRCCHCRGLAAYITASSSTSCCTRWVSTMNTPGATVTNMSKSTGTTSINVRISQLRLWLTDSDRYISWSVSYLLIFCCHQIMPTTSKRGTRIISALRTTTPPLCTMEGKVVQKKRSNQSKRTMLNLTQL